MAEFDKTKGGARGWVRDMSGSTQAVEVVDNKLVIGGHLRGRRSGRRPMRGRTPRRRQPGGNPTLNPFGQCLTRQGIAAYTFQGGLARVWSPTYSGSYSLVWALHAEGSRLHTGGEFKKVNGVVQNSYGRGSRQLHCRRKHRRTREDLAGNFLVNDKVPLDTLRTPIQRSPVGMRFVV